ncbi:hypothetical protein [Rubinisphaera sp. JC750]|uniref:hypothetical protein n=1 Tax=Rubinisphaera sp. JC750 TaxID=2898658 RepID=UPI001F17A3B7|nr:hypothetical protein [Rubinisphaera sp. JC750]
MNQLPRKLKSLQSFAATLLLAAMVYQLGACPCGCLEHNAWSQLLRLDSGDHDHSAADLEKIGSHSPVLLSDHHDCTGEPRTAFVDNAREPRVQGCSTTTLLLSLFVEQASLSNSPAGGDAKYVHSPSRLALDAARSRPALQVYRL